MRALSIHADYRCGHSGVCCSSGWPIPVEPEIEDALRQALVERRLRASAGRAPASLLPPTAGSAARRAGGPRGRRARPLRVPRARHALRVHRQLGEQALASACRQFPRVVTLTPLGVSVTLSHYCPTAAELLFSAQGELQIVEQPPAFPASRRYEGLDAREQWPPLLRPGVLMSWAALERWEQHAVSLLRRRAARARAGSRPAGSGGRSGARAGRRTGAASSPSSRTASSGRRRCGTERRATDEVPVAELRAAWDTVAATVPVDHLRPRPLETIGDQAGVRCWRAGWREQQRPIRRWLAARAFASWLALQGDGLRTAVRGLQLALLVLRAEALRGCAESGRALDAASMKEAFRRADLLLVQLADPAALARRLSRCEGAC